MRAFNPLGWIITAVVGAVAWFTVGQGVLDRFDEQSADTVAAKQLAPVAAKLKKAAGVEASLVSLTLRPGSVEMVAELGGTASGYRWRGGQEKLERFAVGTTGQAGVAATKPFSMRLLDARAPERISRAIAEAEGDDFSLSIGDLARADSGKVVWILRGQIGERGVAYQADPDGSHVKAYDPVSLSRGAQIQECLKRAAGDPQKVTRCVKRLQP